jgi:hypothetical protein
MSIIAFPGHLIRYSLFPMRSILLLGRRFTRFSTFVPVVSIFVSAEYRTTDHLIPSGIIGN